MATVEDILMVKGPGVIVASRDTTVREAVNLMCEANVGSVIIKDGERVEGIFTERDLLRRVVSLGRDPNQTQLGSVMTSPVRSVSLRTSVTRCKDILTHEHIRHLAIVEGGTLIGIIGLRDVLTAKLEEDEKLLYDIARQVEIIGKAG